MLNQHFDHGLMQCMLTDPILEQSHCYQCVFHTLMLFHDATARGSANMLWSPMIFISSVTVSSIWRSIWNLTSMTLKRKYLWNSAPFTSKSFWFAWELPLKYVLHTLKSWSEWSHVKMNGLNESTKRADDSLTWPSTAWASPWVVGAFSHRFLWIHSTSLSWALVMESTHLSTSLEYVSHSSSVSWPSNSFCHQVSKLLRFAFNSLSSSLALDSTKAVQVSAWQSSV